MTVQRPFAVLLTTFSDGTDTYDVDFQGFDAARWLGARRGRDVDPLDGSL